MGEIPFVSIILLPELYHKRKKMADAIQILLVVLALQVLKLSLDVKRLKEKK